MSKKRPSGSKPWKQAVPSMRMTAHTISHTSDTRRNGTMKHWKAFSHYRMTLNTKPWYPITLLKSMPSRRTMTRLRSWPRITCLPIRKTNTPLKCTGFWEMHIIISEIITRRSLLSEIIWKKKMHPEEMHSICWACLISRPVFSLKLPKHLEKSLPKTTRWHRMLTCIWDLPICIWLKRTKHAWHSNRLPLRTQIRRLKNKLPTIMRYVSTKHLIRLSENRWLSLKNSSMNSPPPNMPRW